MRSRQKIIDATLRLIEAGGFGAVNVAAVAEEARVSRQTVYSIFGSREELVSQTVGAAAQEGMAGVQARLAQETSATGFLVELVVAGRAMFRAQPALAALLVAGDGNPIYDDGMIERAIPIAEQLLAGLAERDPRFAPVLREVAEAVTRLALSVILLGSTRTDTDDGLRDFLRIWLVPGLEKLTLTG